ncbi:hypothetical protein M514_27562 [Trichuris suis]|uniref:Uncharacterized protein n=1 Tax=Trichuris suis TaxID=68888 RepID=A0A085LMT5_9BILA|nr:hypothetical protein M513_12842 [Trichuris suis]KFD46283.1 hypothetical protein M513_12844 [Trichuris suis]KFD60260.1 hypothetical protein M514_27562 [Trichuris suis]
MSSSSWPPPIVRTRSAHDDLGDPMAAARSTKDDSVGQSRSARPDEGKMFAKPPLALRAKPSQLPKTAEQIQQRPIS